MSASSAIPCRPLRPLLQPGVGSALRQPPRTGPSGMLPTRPVTPKCLSPKIHAQKKRMNGRASEAARILLSAAFSSGSATRRRAGKPIRNAGVRSSR